ncbi:hypothetical protein D3C71_1710940 [compost metagenome]
MVGGMNVQQQHLLHPVQMLGGKVKSGPSSCMETSMLQSSRKEGDGMRPLTVQEKDQSQTSKQRANKALTANRAKHGYAIRLLKGSPCIVRLDGQDIVLDYELLRGMLRRLKGRRVDMRMRDPFNPYMIILHNDLWGRGKGEIELKQLPDYQREHLNDLPIIELNSD